MHRFFLPSDQWNSPAPTLDAGESHHALDVLRLAVGDRATIFDGKGREAMVQIAGTEGKSVSVKIVQQAKTTPLACAITLAQAIPKGKNMDFIIQKAVELGAAKVAPLISERTVVRIEADEAEKKRLKWSEAAVEACKQCGQNYLPEILTPTSPKRFLESSEKVDLMLIASLQPDSRHIKTVLESYEKEAGRRPKSVTIFVGPEGDFTPAETALAKSHGARPVTLGPIILRTETAALYCLSVLSHELYS